ncbi:MAG: Bax inhibitor-1/YccA family protein [Oligoflexia bacterium]|nr:Bax inhibitor-1/YccA family protein [Oligoflexia bacterium]
MGNNYSVSGTSSRHLAEESARFMSGVYKWMTFGVLTTAIVSYSFSENTDLMSFIIQNRFVFWLLIIAQLGSVFFLSAMIKKISAFAATMIYLLYSALTGTTLSVIFLTYTQASIQSAFFVTSFSFAGLSAFGYLSKRDLGPIGTFCHMGLWGLIGFGVLTLFFPSMMSGTASTVYSLCGILVFAGLAAYDTQKIKNMNVWGREGSDDAQKGTIYGALTLYLDFINLFLSILRLTGKRR